MALSMTALSLPSSAAIRRRPEPTPRPASSAASACSRHGRSERAHSQGWHRRHRRHSPAFAVDQNIEPASQKTEAEAVARMAKSEVKLCWKHTVQTHDRVQQAASQLRDRSCRGLIS